jgi:hypothetical protein
LIVSAADRIALSLLPAIAAALAKACPALGVKEVRCVLVYRRYVRREPAHRARFRHRDSTGGARLPHGCESTHRARRADFPHSDRGRCVDFRHRVLADCGDCLRCDPVRYPYVVEAPVDHATV